MQKTSVILTFFLSLLILHPFAKSLFNFSEITPVEVCSNNCCFIEKNICKRVDKPNQSKKPCCPNGLCNPLENCPFCFIVLSEKLVFLKNVFYEKKVNYQNSNEFAKSEYFFSIFQPPEFENKIA